jgi:hypothetical protein
MTVDLGMSDGTAPPVRARIIQRDCSGDIVTKTFQPYAARAAPPMMRPRARGDLA